MMLKRQNLFAAVTVVSLLLLSIFYIYTKQNATADSNSISDFQSNTLSSANKENEKIIMGAMGNQTERYEDIR
jgi:signal transduction histidine kinase